MLLECISFGKKCDLKGEREEKFCRCQKITAKGLDYLIEQLKGYENLKGVCLNFEM